MRVVVASRSQDEEWKRDALGDETRKIIMRSFAAAHSMSEHGLTFRVGNRAVSPRKLVSFASAGEHGVVLLCPCQHRRTTRST